MLLEINWYKVFYWMTAADAFKTVAGVIAVIGIIATVISTIGYFTSSNAAATEVRDGDPTDKTQQSSNDNEWAIWLRAWKRTFTIVLPMTIIFGVLWALIPTKKDCLLIVAGGSVGTFISTDSSSKALPADVTKYLHLKLNAEIQELGTEAKKELGLQTKKDEFIDKVKDLTKEELIDYLKKDTSILK